MGRGRSDKIAHDPPRGSATASISAVVTGRRRGLLRTCPSSVRTAIRPNRARAVLATSSSMSWSLRYLPLAVEPRERLRTPQFLLSLQHPSTGFPWSPTPPPSAQRWYPPIIQNDPTERDPRSKTLLYPDGFLTSTLRVFRDGFARTIATRKKGDCRAAGERSSLAGTEGSNPSPSTGESVANLTSSLPASISIRGLRASRCFSPPSRGSVALQPGEWRCAVPGGPARRGNGLRHQEGLRAIGDIDNRRKCKNPRTAPDISPESSGGGRSAKLCFALGTKAELNLGLSAQLPMPSNRKLEVLRWSHAMNILLLG